MKPNALSLLGGFLSIHPSHQESYGVVSFPCTFAEHPEGTWRQGHTTEVAQMLRGWLREGRKTQLGVGQREEARVSSTL